MGKGEGLNPSSKGSPGTHGRLSAVRSPEALGNCGFLPAQGPSCASPAPGVSRDLICSGMEETVVRPSVFTVDGQTDIPFTRLGRRRRRRPCTAAQVGLGLLLLLLAAGLAVQGWFLLQLHWRLGAMVTPLLVSGAWGSWQVGLLCHWASLCACVCRTGDRPRAAQGKSVLLSETQFLHL